MRLKRKTKRFDPSKTWQSFRDAKAPAGSRAPLRVSLSPLRFRAIVSGCSSRKSASACAGFVSVMSLFPVDWGRVPRAISSRGSFARGRRLNQPLQLGRVLRFVTVALKAIGTLSDSPL